MADSNQPVETPLIPTPKPPTELSVNTQLVTQTIPKSDSGPFSSSSSINRKSVKFSKSISAAIIQSKEDDSDEEEEPDQFHPALAAIPNISLKWRQNSRDPDEIHVEPRVKKSVEDSPYRETLITQTNLEGESSALNTQDPYGRPSFLVPDSTHLQIPIDSADNSHSPCLKAILQDKSMNNLLARVSTDSRTGNIYEEPIIELKNIHKTYLLGIEGVAALRGVSLKIFKGEWVAIYGTSGGGKTSLLNIMGTIDKPTKGELKICGTLITPNTKDEVFSDLRLRRLGFVFQTFNLIPSMTAMENVELPMILKGEHSPSERKKRAAGDLDTLNTLNIIYHLHHLNHTENMTMVMVTHDVYLKNFCHRVIYMRDGKVAKIQRVPQEKRDNALMELKRKWMKIKGHAFNASNRNSQNRSAAQLNISTPAMPSLFQLSTSFNKINLDSDSEEENVEVHAKCSAKAGKLTEIREPGDYDTYSKNSGVTPTLPLGAFPNEYINQLLRLGVQDN